MASRQRPAALPGRFPYHDAGLGESNARGVAKGAGATRTVPRPPVHRALRFGAGCVLHPQDWERSMKPRFLLPAVLVAGGLLSASAGFAASTGTAAVTLGASANAVLQVLDPFFSIIPTALDYSNDYVEATGAAGLRVR